MLTTLAAVVLTITCASAAQAVSFRTHVSLTGSDANTATNCSRSSPCRNFSAAYGVTSPGGEIVALDSAGFGGLTITTSVTILAIPGQVGLTQVATGTSGIHVNAGVNDVVILKNLHFGGSGAASTNGILHSSGKLIIENCAFSQMTNGILVNSTNAKALARYSTFNANTRGAYVTSGTLDLDHCEIAANTTGIRADGAGMVSITTVVRVSRSDIINNGTGVHMNNAGVRPINDGGCNARNVFFHTGGVNPHNVNSAGNTVGLLTDGASDIQNCGGQTSIGVYQSAP